MGFFDQIGKKAAETVQGAKDKTNRFSNEMKLKTKISDKKDRISVLHVEIGKEIYENYSKGIESNTESIISKCKEIDNINNELKDLNKDLLALKDLKICVSCGAQVASIAEFCPRCGAKQVAVVNNVTEEVKTAEVVDVKNVEENNNNEETNAENNNSEN